MRHFVILTSWVGGPTGLKLGATLCHIDSYGILWYTSHMLIKGATICPIVSRGTYARLSHMVNIKYLTKGLLQSLNAKAIKGKLNRTLKGLEDLDAYLKYPVEQVFMCDDNIARCFIAVGSSADNLTTVQLDMDLEDYDSLPVHIS